VVLKKNAVVKVGDRVVDHNTVFRAGEYLPFTISKANGEWVWIGVGWVRKIEVRTPDQALDEFRAARLRDASDPQLHMDLARFYQKIGEYEKARDAWEFTIQFWPDNADAWNGLAFLQATSPNAKVWNGDKALASAPKACELSKWKSYYAFDTLAAAYASKGYFEDAVRWQRKAITLTGSNALKEGCAQRLELYKAGKTWNVPGGLVPPINAPQ
jgi:tetratricopeptide (TPR) repeat protein